MKDYWISGTDGDNKCSISFSDTDLLDTGNWTPRTSMFGHPHIRPSQIDAFLRAVTTIQRNWNPSGRSESEDARKGVDARQEAAKILEAAGWKVEMGERDDALAPKEARANMRMPADLWAWARQQPEGASDLVRRLLEQERARQEAGSK